MRDPVGVTPAQVQKAAAMKAAAIARGVTIGDPKVPTDVEQKPVFGYRVVKTFSDVERHQHKLYQAGTILRDPVVIAHVARKGAALELVERDPNEPEGEKPAEQPVPNIGSLLRRDKTAE